MNRIDTWFPKAVLVCEDFDKSQLNYYISSILDWFKENDSVRSSIFEVSSTHLTNSDMHKDFRFSKLAIYFLDKARYFAKEMGYSSHSINKLFIKSMWVNISKEGDFLESHIHQNSFLSGVFYLQAPTDSKIIFYDHSDMSMIPETLNYLSYTNTVYDCLPGRMLMWKSNLQHGTIKQPAGADKIVISFNILFKND